MGHPDGDEIRVAISELRKAAGDWRAEKQPIAEAGRIAGTLTLSGLELGIFFPLQGPYTTLTTAVDRRCQAGSKEFGEIADTLGAVANIYESEEQRHVHDLKQLW
jgi:hypothetical protein